jgi:hypothetical protein
MLIDHPADISDLLKRGYPRLPLRSTSAALLWQDASLLLPARSSPIFLYIQCPSMLWSKEWSKLTLPVQVNSHACVPMYSQYR